MLYWQLFTKILRSSTYVLNQPLQHGKEEIGKRQSKPNCMILYRAEFLHSIRDENTKNCYWTHLPYSHASSPVSVHIPDDTLAAT